MFVPLPKEHFSHVESPKVFGLALNLTPKNQCRVPARAQKKDQASSLGLVFLVRAPRIGVMFSARSITEPNNKCLISVLIDKH